MRGLKRPTKGIRNTSSVKRPEGSAPKQRGGTPAVNTDPQGVEGGLGGAGGLPRGEARW